MALKRLQVHSSDNWKGIIPPTHNPAVQLPPIYSAKFCNQSGYHQFLALADEDGKVRVALPGAAHPPGTHSPLHFPCRWLFWTRTETLRTDSIRSWAISAMIMQSVISLGLRANRSSFRPPVSAILTPTYILIVQH